MWAEASLGLDFFRSFCIKAKRTLKENTNTAELLRSFSGANQKQMCE